MYIHLGNEISVKKKNIVGIFDIENTTISKIPDIFWKMQPKREE